MKSISAKGNQIIEQQGGVALREGFLGEVGFKGNFRSYNIPNYWRRKKPAF